MTGRWSSPISRLHLRARVGVVACAALVLAFVAAARAEAYVSFVASWGDIGSAPGQFGWGGEPSVAVGPSGDVYVTDRGNDRVNVYTATGSFVRSFGTPFYGTPARPGGFRSPIGIAASRSGDVYVLDDVSKSCDSAL